MSVSMTELLDLDASGLTEDERFAIQFAFEIAFEIALEEFAAQAEEETKLFLTHGASALLKLGITLDGMTITQQYIPKTLN
jgi:hypothetical protein